jgi:hypothetical protein
MLWTRHYVLLQLKFFFKEQKIPEDFRHEKVYVGAGSLVVLMEGSPSSQSNVATQWQTIRTI